MVVIRMSLKVHLILVDRLLGYLGVRRRGVPGTRPGARKTGTGTRGEPETRRVPGIVVRVVRPAAVRVARGHRGYGTRIVGKLRYRLGFSMGTRRAGVLGVGPPAGIGGVIAFGFELLRADVIHLLQWRY